VSRCARAAAPCDAHWGCVLGWVDAAAARAPHASHVHIPRYPGVSRKYRRRLLHGTRRNSSQPGSISYTHAPQDNQSDLFHLFQSVSVSMQLAGHPATLALGRLPVPLNTKNYRAQSCGARQLANSGNLPHTARDVACDAHAEYPPQLGLVAGTPDKDACGVGFVGELSKNATRKCVTDALDMLVRMTHRGACGCEENTGMHSDTTDIRRWPLHCLAVFYSTRSHSKIIHMVSRSIAGACHWVRYTIVGVSSSRQLAQYCRSYRRAAPFM